MWSLLSASRKGFPSALIASRHARRLSSVSPSGHDDVLASFRAIVGSANVLDGRSETTQTASYLKGQRLGRGHAPAIALPTRLAQVPRLVAAAVDAGCAVVVQGTNTGLTGASVPRDGDGRPEVIVSTRRLNAVVPVDGGERVLCMAGVGLASLKNFVARHFPGRQSHSTLGSNFLNPTTAAGVAFGSGGTQIRKGPSTTERALYLKVDAAPEGSNKKAVVKVVNTLGIEGLDAVEGEFTADNDDGKQGEGADKGVIPKLDAILEEIGEDVGENRHDHKLKSNATYGTHPSHDENYKTELCTFDDRPTRFNADTKGLDCNRSEGKVLILATVHDTFKEPDTMKTYWVAFRDLDAAIRFKKDVALTDPENLPESLEYMDRDCFEIIDRAGRFMGHFIRMFGADHPMVARGWALKVMIEALPGLSVLPDTIQYHMNPLLPPVLPRAVMDLGKHPERNHHILTAVGDYGDSGSVASFEERLARFCAEHKGTVDVYELATASERDGANAFRYTAAAAFPTYCAGKNLQSVSVDYALPKNRSTAPEIPAAEAPAKRMRYSHFGCNVVHEDLAYEQGVDTHGAKMNFKHIVDEVCSGRLPSEHGHGTEYVAPMATKQRWMKMDPLNVMNPGVGGLSTNYRYE